MTTCHSLKLVQDEIIGDPLDAKMFEFTGWTFEEGGKIYEFIPEVEGIKEDERASFVSKDGLPRGRYVARNGPEREGYASVRPPASLGMVHRPKQ
jgi:hypothetical protein